MNVAARDLRSYHLARLLHLVPQLHRVYAENCFLVPLFFSCVSAKAKAHAKLILLCLHRRLSPTCTPDVYEHILSFLSFPELVLVAPETPLGSPSLLHSDSAEQLPPTGVKKRMREEMETGVSPVSLQSSIAGVREATNERIENTEKQGKEQLESPEHHNVREVSTHIADGEKGMRITSRTTTTTTTTGTTTGTATGEIPTTTLADPMFLVRPPWTLNSEKAMTHLFVRMVSEHQHNEETMNTFFGRYGQVSCKLQERRQIQDTSRPGVVIHVQDFIVTVDSTHNALQAVRHAYYPELAFIALHEPLFNTYTLADVDRILNDVSVEIIEEPCISDLAPDGEEILLPPSQTFIPDVVVDGLPYWLTVDQLRASFSQYGRVEDVRMAVDDRSGAFTGAALLRMSSVEEAVAASEGLNGEILKGHTLVSGVLNSNLDIESLRHGTIIQRADEVLPADYDITVNGRRWV
ncbi:RNA recognition motif domain [Trypanosoma melophagium]|uniref:RNA recognition motif domain n=1 Tax=Trypanosoma melophagium TaxID=715481 RepID=UPI00351A8F7C|nr:RNA recognition motif domain [Trypanosoma melophagium]